MKLMTAATFAIHQDLANEGFDLESDEYYTEVDARLKKVFHRLSKNLKKQKNLQQRVASADRNTELQHQVKKNKTFSI